MAKIYILIVDDEPSILEAVTRDLAAFEDLFPLETAETAAEARKVIQSILGKEDQVGLILCDHVMPEECGADLLVSMQNEMGMQATRKVLLTGQAGLEATIKAVNEGDLNYYIEKPWSAEHLVNIVKEQLTHYMLGTDQNALPFISCLNQERVLNAIHRKGPSANE